MLRHVKVVAALLLTVFVTPAFGQAKLWQKIWTSNDDAFAFTRTAIVLPDGSALYLNASDLPSVIKVDATGQVVWRHEDPVPAGSRVDFRAFAVDPGGDVYLVGLREGGEEFSFIRKLYGASGAVLWQTKVVAVDATVFLNQPFYRSDGVIVCPAVHGGVHEIRSFSANSGNQRGVIPNPFSSGGVQMLKNGDLVGRTSPLSIGRYRTQNAVILWTKQLPSETGGSDSRQVSQLIVSDNGELFVRGTRRKGTVWAPDLARINLADGTEMWSFTPTGTPVVQTGSNGETIVASADSSAKDLKVFRLGPANGKVTWTTSLPGDPSLSGPSSRLITLLPTGQTFITYLQGTFTNSGPVSIGSALLNTTTGAVKFNKLTSPPYTLREFPFAQGLGPDGVMNIASRGTAAPGDYATFVSLRTTNGNRVQTKLLISKGPVPNWVHESHDEGAIFTVGRTYTSWLVQSISKGGQVHWQKLMRRSLASEIIAYPADIAAMATYRSPWGGLSEMYVLGNLQTYGEIIALDGETGDVLWRRVPEYATTSIAVAGINPLLIAYGYHPTTGQAVLMGLDRANGNPLWSLPLNLQFFGNAKMLPTNDGHLLIYGSQDIAKVNLSTGVVEWTKHFDGYISGRPALTDDAFYYSITGLPTIGVYRIALSNGALVWAREAASSEAYFGDVSVSGNHLVVLNRTGEQLKVSRRSAATGLENAAVGVPATPDLSLSFWDLKATNDGKAYLLTTEFRNSPDFFRQNQVGLTHLLDFANSKVKWTRVLQGPEFTTSYVHRVHLDAQGNAIVVGSLGRAGADGIASSFVTTCYAK